MIISGVKILRSLTTNGKWNALRIASCCKFSTSPACVQQSSEKEFILRHQATPNKSSNTNWLTYRVASVGLLGCLTACFFCPGNMVLDFATVTLLVHHNHLGMKSVISDYAPLFFKPGVVKVFMSVWMLISIVTLALLYNFSYNDIGFSKALVKFFNL